jgi:hypothetical protein
LHLRRPCGILSAPERIGLSSPKEPSMSATPAAPAPTDAGVIAYLSALPDDRRAIVRALRDTIVRNLPDGYEEGIQYGMIGYFVPHARCPEGYHCDPKQPVPFVSVASQKSHVGLYLFCVYLDEARRERFAERWVADGHKLDMGKGCVRIKRLDDVPLDLVGETVASVPVDAFLANYEANLSEKVREKRARQRAKRAAAAG